MRINPFSGPMAATPPSTEAGGANTTFDQLIAKAKDGRGGRPSQPRPPRDGPGPRPMPPEPKPIPRPIGPPEVTSLAGGEEGPIGPPIVECPPPKPGPVPPNPTPPPDVTTLAVGEEGGGDLPVCELPKPKPPIGKPDDPIMTTMALGEEGDPGLPVCELPKPIGRDPITWPREQPVTLFPLPGGGMGAKGPFLIEDPAPQPAAIDRAVTTKDTDADKT